jgi:hypothetical protein
MNRVRIVAVVLAGCAAIAPGLAFAVAQVSAASHPHAIEAQGVVSPGEEYLWS